MTAKGNEERMTQSKDADTAEVHYAGKLEHGTVFDASLNRDPCDLQ